MSAFPVKMKTKPQAFPQNPTRVFIAERSIWSYDFPVREQVRSAKVTAEVALIFARLCAWPSLLLLATSCSAAHPELSATRLQATAMQGPELMPLLRTELERVLRESGNPRRTLALPASGNCSVENHWLYTENGGCIVGTPVEIHWEYRNIGDYDQNGEVNIADLVPIGQYFGSDSSSNDWDFAARSDGDRNGEINSADVTPLGLNFGGSIDGYVVQATTSPDDEGTWQEVSQIGLGEGVLPVTGGQRSFMVSLPDPGENEWYRIVPAYQGVLGEPSERLAYSVYAEGPNIYIDPISAPSGSTVTISLSSDAEWVSFDECTWFMDGTWYCADPHGPSITVTLGPPGEYELTVQTPDLSWWGRTLWFTVTPSDDLHTLP